MVLELMQERRSDPSFKTPDEDELVIHLRLGDVVENSPSDVETMLIKGAVPRHSAAYGSRSSIKSVYEYLSNIADSGSSKVTIVGGSHHPDNYRKSRVYANCLWQSIEKAGYIVGMQVDGSDPDHDFYFMASARKIAVSTGGFSRLVGRLVELSGGTIVGRSF